MALLPSRFNAPAPVRLPALPGDRTNFAAWAVGNAHLDPIFHINLVDDQLAHFKTERSPEGNPWKRLRPATLRKKRKLGLDNGILRMTTRMRDAIEVRASERGDPFLFVDVGPITAKLGGYEPRASVHQTGSSDGRIPRRSFMGFTTKMARRYARQFAERLGSYEAW